MKRALLVLATAIPVLLLAELLFFLSVIHSQPVLEKADLIAVFTGPGPRVEEGYRLANQGYGSHLVISRASASEVEAFQRKFKTTDGFLPIVEDKARTTLENALYTKRILAEQNMHSVILVSLWDHIPRSYLLLKILTLGSDLRIQYFKVPTGRIAAGNWYRFTEGWKRIHNEMVELWGSFFEFARFLFKAGLPTDPPNNSTFVAFLRDAILFDLEPIHP